MNILPHKSWHVRTKKNIAKVRKDEAEAAIEEEKRKQRILLAESESRINYLRKQKYLPSKDKEKYSETIINNYDNDGHINLFGNSDNRTEPVVKENKEHIKEKKEEKEKYEKQIGYLTYLGQDTNEALKLKSWYEISPEKHKLEIEKKLIKSKSKDFYDPLENFKSEKQKKLIKLGYSDKNKKIDKKKKTIEELRAERLKREKKEKERQELILKKINKVDEKQKEETKTSSTIKITQKYNNQFNPMYAKQNM